MSLSGNSIGVGAIARFVGKSESWCRRTIDSLQLGTRDSAGRRQLSPEDVSQLVATSAARRA